jgi:glutathione S-transferase
MSDLKIYGHIISRASRVMWMAEELGIDYDLETVDVHKGDQNAPDYLALNPNARVPAIKDGDTVLWESLAINLYLAKKHGGPLAPKSPQEEARAVQWSMWALTEAEDNCVILIQKAMGIQDHDAAKVAAAGEALARPLGVLEGILGGQDTLLGGEFSVADLNVACVLGTLPRAKFDLGPYPKVAAWLKAGMERPASGRIGKMRAAAMKH